LSSVNLYYNYFVPQNPVRAAEVLSCLAVALSDPTFGRIVLLAEAGSVAPAGGKCGVWPSSSRPLITDYFEAVRGTSADDDVNVIINSDCFLDPRTSGRVQRVRAGEACCLSRVELESIVPLRVNRTLTRQLRPVRYAMQDSWIFRGKPRDGMFLDYPLGRLGCDNRLAYELKTAGYEITDRYRQLRLMHYHVSQSRNWTAADRVPGPYAFPPKPFDQRILDRMIHTSKQVKRWLGAAPEEPATDYLKVIDSESRASERDKPQAVAPRVDETVAAGRNTQPPR
jgi:hypothetical protein